ncbi:MAG: hypothetical protein ACYC66_15300 [Chloroflexota bacterium]
MKRLFLAVLLATATLLAIGGVALAQAGPEFRLGFKALADQVPAAVGEPLEDEHGTTNGDVIQRTTRGLMVWRKADRWTTFTNGATTWLLGPFGLQSRSNGELFPWEQPSAGTAPVALPVVELPAPAPAPAPTAPAPAPPAPTPVPLGSYSPDVKAMDDESGGRGVMVKGFLQEVDAEWARVWGWRPRRPTTVYLYYDGYGMADGMSQILGHNLSWSDRDRIAITNAVARGVDRGTGGWAILMNLTYRSGLDDWEETTKANLLHEYGYIMQSDLFGEAGPQWYREGFAQWIAYAKVPGTISEKSVVAYAESFKEKNSLPSLMTLNGDWSGTLNAGPEGYQAAYGASYLAVKYLSGRVGGMPLLQTLERVAAGESFESALQNATGYSVSKLEGEYRSSI